MLNVHYISKSFEQKQVLNNVSIYVAEKEIVGIMGQSGSGKSTLARILCGLEKADTGNATFYEHTLIDTNQSYFREKVPQIQYIPQQPFSALDPRQRIIDAICEPLIYHKLVKSKTEAEATALILLKKVWLDENIIRRYPSQISGGQAQRVIIARALALQPKLIIADEATAMLDTLSQAQVIGIFRNLVSEENISIIMVSHDKVLIEKTAFKTYYLKNTQIKEI